MKPRILLLVTAFSLFTIITNLYAQGTAFTYQGLLNVTGQPANGSHDFRSYLRDALTAGNPVGATNAVALAAVSNGLFTVTLDFGSGVETTA